LRLALLAMPVKLLPPENWRKRVTGKFDMTGQHRWRGAQDVERRLVGIAAGAAVKINVTGVRQPGAVTVVCR